ncbi:hypothetical protein TrLO_g6955 [Triparma laevis f. longispina]|uniref:Uncharacterized protein n=1 Tax=Triparma laevis f. longispina TaxID=1714387 RepID=A0A9W7AK58_9STRA|nr:hypothetical protein TrLO_g6955 [Triparma laevis f. longispina]
MRGSEERVGAFSDGVCEKAVVHVYNVEQLNEQPRNATSIRGLPSKPTWEDFWDYFDQLIESNVDDAG